MPARDPLALFVQIGDGFATIFRRAPAFEARSTGASWFASAGEANGIYNWVGLGDASPASEATLRETAGLLRERRHEGLVYYPPEAETGLADAFRDLGLGEPDVSPLMACEASDVPPPEVRDVAVERVADPATLAAALAVTSATFELPLEESLRVFNAGLLEEPAVSIYAARRGGPVVGTLISSRLGSAVSIDVVTVDTSAQRQGIGRAMMLHAMHEHMAAGATSFHLISSQEGTRLYDQLGFTTLMPTLIRPIPVEPLAQDRVVV